MEKAGYFKFLQAKPPANEEDIVRFVKYFREVNDDYVRLMREATEVEFAATNGRYVRIHGPMRCIEMFEAYRIGEWVPGAVPIGDDGSCSFIHYATGYRGNGLYIAEYSICNPDDTKWLAPTMLDFLVHGQGADQLG